MTRLILIDATPYGPEPSGARRRTTELLRRVPALLPTDVFEVHWAQDGGGPPPDLQADNLVHATDDISCRGGVRRWLRRRRALKRRHAQAPFTHLLSDYGPIVRPELVANIVTLHDLRFLHGYGGWLRAAYGRMGYGHALRAAHAVVAVSDAVAEEARKRYRLEGSHRPRVIPNAPAPVFRPPERDEREGVLVVGRDEPRKARGAATDAAARAGQALRIVSGELDDEALRHAYGAARWILAPSVEEGFDLPVVEALACGTPVIASNIGAHRDLVARGAEGLVLVPPPTMAGGAWHWPEAEARLGEPPPTTVSPPPWSWDDAAAGLAAVIRDDASR